jgi:hypothetical protein
VTNSDWLIMIYKASIFELGLRKIRRTQRPSRTADHKQASGLRSVQDSIYNIADILENSVDISHVVQH